ncbi:hypothetical protein BJX99DRAFT_240975 [Aspergillus californicus]
MGVMGAMYAVTSFIGPFLGGAFTDRINWRWLLPQSPNRCGCCAHYFCLIPDTRGCQTHRCTPEGKDHPARSHWLCIDHG